MNLEVKLEVSIFSKPEKNGSSSINWLEVL